MRTISVGSESAWRGLLNATLQSMGHKTCSWWGWAPPERSQDNSFEQRCCSTPVHDAEQVVRPRRLVDTEINIRVGENLRKLESVHGCVKLGDWLRLG